MEKEIMERFIALEVEYDTQKNTIPYKKLSPSSKKKVWWKDAAGHSWDSTVANRVYGGNNCPYCSHRKVLEGFNDLKATNPEILSMWSPENKISPTEVMAKSNKKVKWVCEHGHTWEARISDVIAGKGCPVCSGNAVQEGVNDLATTHPSIAAEWHPIKNGSLTPQMVSFGSEKKVWWKDSEGNEWPERINKRTSRKLGCPKKYKKQ